MGRADSKFKVTDEVRALLIGSADVKSLIGDRIFPLFAPKGTEGDFIAYVRDEYAIDRNAMGITTTRCKVFVCAVCEKYPASQKLAELIFDALDNVNTPSGACVRLIDSTEDCEDGKYIQVLLFSIE